MRSRDHKISHGLVIDLLCPFFEHSPTKQLLNNHVELSLSACYNIASFLLPYSLYVILVFGLSSSLIFSCGKHLQWDWSRRPRLYLCLVSQALSREARSHLRIVESLLRSGGKQPVGYQCLDSWAGEYARRLVPWYRSTLSWSHRCTVDTVSKHFHKPIGIPRD